MSLKTLLFVSASRLERPAEEAELRAIVAAGRGRNAALGVRATLVAARGLFAEVLDGPEDSLRVLIPSIAADPRHERFTIVLDREATPPLPGRPGMDLVYRGGSLYVARAIAPLLGLDHATTPTAPLAARLLFLIRELAGTGR